MNYYTDWDPYCVKWLANLVEAGHLPKGEVDQVDITRLSAERLYNKQQVHLFAGIGGWPLALQLAGWPSDKPVWTGSCPCQPFSNAGKQKGTEDVRHLWPEMLRLIKICQPPTIFGEQVASKLGRRWLAGIRTDLEVLGYRFAAADLCAASVGAPHIRQRLYWVADRMGISNSPGCSTRECPTTSMGYRSTTESASSDRRMGNTNHEGLQGRSEHTREYANQQSPWATSEFITCRDGKARRIESSIQPLVNGVSGRVGRLRAYGNAIVPQVAAAFIKSYMDVVDEDL